jgi:hypothetical protein
LGAVAVKAVTKKDVAKFLDGVQLGKSAEKRPKGERRRGTPVAGGPGAAARTVGLLGGYAVLQEYREDNPVRAFAGRLIRRARRT